MLNLAADSPDRLILGKRSIKRVRPVGQAGGLGKPYRLTVCAAFERVWEQIVAHHGIDWCGFDSVRAAYSALHAYGQPQPSIDSQDGSAAGGCGAPRVISVELWDTSRPDELVSAEVGVLVSAPGF